MFSFRVKNELFLGQYLKRGLNMEDPLFVSLLMFTTTVSERNLVFIGDRKNSSIRKGYLLTKNPNY